MNRKEFIIKAGAASALSLIGVSLVSCSDDSADSIPGPDNKLEVDLSVSPFNSLLNNNGWVLHPDENILLVTVDEEIRAFSSVCPHSQCARQWEYETGIFQCLCHNSRFDTTGSVLQGPANRNLTEIPVSRNENILILD